MDTPLSLTRVRHRLAKLAGKDLDALAREARVSRATIYRLRTLPDYSTVRLSTLTRIHAALAKRAA